MTCKSIYVVDSFTLQELSLYETNFEPSPQIIVPNCFHINELPIILLQREEFVKAEDVLFSGLKDALVRANFKLLGCLKFPGYFNLEGTNNFLIIGYDILCGELQMYRITLDSIFSG